MALIKNEKAIKNVVFSHKNTVNYQVNKQM